MGTVASQYDPSGANPQFSLRGLAYVHIVESPTPHDLIDGRTEGNALWEALRLAGIPVSYNLVTNLETFDVALDERLRSAMRSSGLFPILHFSVHGDKHGIGLTDGTHITWEVLRQKVLALNEEMKGGLIICLSSCFGSFGKRMAQTIDGRLGYFALVGHNESVKWDDAAVAFVAFYHRLFKGIMLPDAVAAMRAASGDPRWDFNLGPLEQRAWSELINSLHAYLQGLDRQE